MPVFHNYILDFKLDTVEKLGIIILSSNSNKSYIFVVLSDSDVTFFGEGIIRPFVHFSCLFCLSYHIYQPLRSGRI